MKNKIKQIILNLGANACGIADILSISLKITELPIALSKLSDVSYKSSSYKRELEQ